MIGRHLTGKLFLRTLPVFLILWLVMAILLLLLNVRYQESRLESAVNTARRYAASDYSEIWAGMASEEEKPAILAWRLTSENLLGSYGGVFLSRLYDLAGQELARSQMAMGAVALPGQGVYDHYIFFDPVLTDGEQVALAKRLGEDRGLFHFYGGNKSAGETTALYGEVVGVQEGSCIYPQKITLWFEDGPVVLMESDSTFFEGKELSTLTFDRARFSSMLLWGKESPGRMLDLWRQAEGQLDRHLEGYNPSPSSSLSSSDGTEIGLVSAEQMILVGSSWACGTLRLSMWDMLPVTVITLAAAVYLALLTARVQARSIRRERDFANAAAHELKTPLAVLRAHAECLKEDIEPEKRGEYLEVILDEADRMDGLVGELLTLSRLEAGAAGNPGGPVELAEVVRASFDRLALPAREKGVRIALDLNPCRTAGDGAQLGRLADNLASNALRHCTPGGEIRVGLAVEGNTLRLTVENDGDPIPPEDLPRIWEPFYRGDRARSRETGGAGLGLALVRAIAERHGGRCTAENRPGAVYFSVTLPALQSTQ